MEEFSNILARNAGQMAAAQPPRRPPPRSERSPTMPAHAVPLRIRRRRTINEINMVLFIDIDVVLLIIFMVSARR